MSEATGYGYENTAIGNLIQSEIMTVEQWNDENRRTKDTTPERELLFAVLEDAVRCYIEPVRHNRKRLFHDAQAWFFTDDTSGPEAGYFSFDYICQVLDINASWFRTNLLNAKARGLNKVAFRLNPLRTKAPTDKETVNAE